MRGSYFLIGLLLLCSSGGGASAQTAKPGDGNFHCPNSTTIIGFSNGVQLTALHAIDRGCAFKLGNARWEFFSAWVRPDALVDPTSRGKAEALWPLTVGKTVTFEDDPGVAVSLSHPVFVTRKVTMTVVSHGPITVKAGRYDAYAVDVKAEATANTYSRLDFIRVVRYYYAPAVGMYIKAEILDGLEDPPLLTGLTSELQPSSLAPSFEAVWISTP